MQGTNLHIQSLHAVTHTLESFNVRVINCSRKQLCRRCAEGVEIETQLGDSGTLSKGRSVHADLALTTGKRVETISKVSFFFRCRCSFWATKTLVRLSTLGRGYESPYLCQMITSHFYSSRKIFLIDSSSI